ncbi:hypothetical protein G7Y89_g192 [Cudoniella acicularis]|uniref:carnosine N-methyltransferase n=1 Tax=Cudoniella acicularis TaxID=354080 RepID=A0A8H4W8I8_9HELO|nr:hypothetical protein G7Y89_g192 [Cudoniella acicularis]
MSAIEWEGNLETYGDDEERRVLFGALSSFYQYAKVAHFNTTHLRRQSFYALPRAHWELLAKPPFSYLETLDSVDAAIDKNAELALAILYSGLQSFGLSLPPSKEANSKNDWRAAASSNDLEKARSTLRQFFRDWSEEGQSERDACYGPVIKVLRKESSLHPETKMRVLVPGAGLGRLVFELSCAGFHSEDRTNHLRSVQVPDISPGITLAGVEGAGEMSMSASDFLLLYGSEDQKDTFDAVATVFFLDTAPNVIRYIEAIKSCLRQGGLLVNVGPLLWHFENNSPGSHGRENNSLPTIDNKGIADPGSVELTDDEVVSLVENFGFDIEFRESGISAPYIQDTESMLQNTYKASHWKVDIVSMTFNKNSQRHSQQFPVTKAPMPSNNFDEAIQSHKFQGWLSDSVPQIDRTMAPKATPKKLTSQEFLEKVTGPRVDIYVGANKKHYSLPKKLFCYYSTHFYRCFNGDFVEGKIQKLELPKDKIEDFEILVEYMLRGGGGLTFTTTKVDHAAYNECVEFVTYADKYGLGDAAAVICEPLRKFAISVSASYYRQSFIEASHIELIYRTTSPGNPLRPLFAELVLSCFGFDGIKVFSKQEDEVDGYAQNLLKAIHTSRKPKQTVQWTDPFTDSVRSN